MGFAINDPKGHLDSFLLSPFFNLGQSFEKLSTDRFFVTVTRVGLESLVQIVKH